ncbi:MAG: DUF2490 domain-containing protein [bacterium]|nr:DUF2490 domain-containing protein [bacterium]
MFLPKRIKFLCWVFILWIGFGIGSRPALAKDNDFQFWTTLALNHKFKESKFSLHYLAEGRLQNNASEFLLFLTFLGFRYRLLSWFDLGFFYRIQKFNDQPVQQVPYPEFNFYVSAGPIDIHDRNRFQTFISSEATTFQYRNLLEFSHTFEHGDFRFKPNFFNEIFLGSNGNPISQNRVGAGNGFGFFNGKFFFELYYLLQVVRTGTPAFFEKRHVLGSKFIINI